MSDTEAGDPNGAAPPRYDQITSNPEGTLAEHEDVMRVVYQSDQNGSMVGVETSLLRGSEIAQQQQQPQSQYFGQGELESDSAGENQLGAAAHQQLSRAASTLPSVAEESTTSSGGGTSQANQANGPEGQNYAHIAGGQNNLAYIDESHTGAGGTKGQEQYGGTATTQYSATPDPTFPMYSIVNKPPLAEQQQQADQYFNETLGGTAATSFYSNVYQQQQRPSSEQEQALETGATGPLAEYARNQDLVNQEPEADLDEETKVNQEIGELLARQKGAVEKGSFRHNFRKKLGLSISTNENDLTTYRQRFLEESSAATVASSSLATKSRTHSKDDDYNDINDESLPKFKRTHSVSFNIHASRSNRLSVDIRNLPSYLTHKRTSIVDVAKGAMSSLLSSFGGGSGSGPGSSVSDRRDSYVTTPDEDEEPIFEEPIAPTLSLGQRVALVRSGGSEFGTVGWIGQLPEVEDDWIVGVIFDNMIGNCDGAFNGVRYFYARENFAMFVPLSALTKTDNYIGRPETGTMLSRMSIALKPGQLISIQRSSIRLQHCFLNAPHQRVGHDVRAVSNRLHCQCHNCGPCAHLTKQGRVAAMPHFGSHHLPHRKRNSLAHAAVELLAHHHHHFHEEEEEHEEKDYQFGDNAAHACNFVRYSCCQQNGVRGHGFSSDCEMVRPELLDNLIHAPKAPHRRSRPRRARRRQCEQQLEALGSSPQPLQLGANEGQLSLEEKAAEAAVCEQQQQQLQIAGPALDVAGGTMSSVARTSERTPTGEVGNSSRSSSRSSSYSTGSSSSRSASSTRSNSPQNAHQRQQRPAYNFYTFDSTTTYRPASGGSGTVGGVYNTIDSQISIMDQRRFVYQRDSSAFIHSAPVQEDSRFGDDYYDGSELDAGQLGLGKRILRCFGCLKRRSHAPRRGHRQRRSRRGSGHSSISSLPKRKLSAKDKLIEYRRRQSTFVPSTLAKPHEDFASHGIILPQSSGPPRPYREEDGNNSDYSSYSKSSSCSLSHRSNPPAESGVVAGQHLDSDNNHQQQTMEHLLSGPGANGFGLKCTADSCNGEHHSLSNINYGDYTFGDGYEAYKKNEFSRDSALADLAYSSDTFKTNSSCDTLKHLVDKSINELVPQPPGMATEHLFVSPISTHDDSECNYCAEQACNLVSEQVEISSPTASTVSVLGASTSEEQENEICQAIERMDLEEKNATGPG